MEEEREIRPRTPSPQRDPIFIWSTPDRLDLIFYVERDGKLPKNKDWDYGQAYEDAITFPNHKLALVTEQTAEQWSRWYYVKDRDAQDAYNFAYTQADIGGTKFDAVQRTYVELRATFNPSTPAQGAAAPSPNAATHALVGRKQDRIGQKELDSLYVVDVRTYAKLVSLTSVDFDDVFGGTLTSTQTLVLGTLPGSGFGMQENGKVKEGRQLTAAWHVIIDRDPVPAFMFSTGRTYTTTTNFSWPGVLSGVREDAWERTEGGIDRVATPLFSREAYDGPTKAVVVETFHATPPTPDSISPMLPMPIILNTPIFDLRVGPTLHDEVIYVVSTGTNHPVYEYTAGNFVFDETNYVDWPETLLISDVVRPFRGGYLRTKNTVYRPS